MEIIIVTISCINIIVNIQKNLQHSFQGLFPEPYANMANIGQEDW